MAHPLRRFFTSIPGISILLVCWGLVLAVGVGYFALRERPELVRERILAAATQHLPGYALSVGQLSPALWPSPGVRAETLILRAPDGSALFAEACSVHFSWGDLLSGSLVPDRVGLEKAFVRLVHTPAQAAVPTLPAKKNAPPAAYAALTALSGLTVDVVDTTLDLHFAGGSLGATGLTGQITAPSGIAAGMLGVDPGTCSLRWASLTASGFGPNISLKNGTLDVAELRLSPTSTGLLRTGSMTFAAQGAVGNALRDANLHLTAALGLTAGPPDVHGELGIDGTAHLNGIPVAMNIKVPFGSRDVRQNVDIRNATVVMEDNHASLTATWLPDDNSLTGKVDVARLSLPRWFAFGRGLPAGLVTALDDINGSFTFRLVNGSLVAPDLRLNLRGIPFTGSAGVPDFKKPVIVLKAGAAKADINKIFPELTEKAVKEPHFAQPPLLGGGTRLPDDSPDVGFDIRLKSDEAVFWNFSGKDFELRLSPAWEGASVEGVKLEAGFDHFYGGRVQAELDTRNNLSLNLTLSGVDAEKMSQAMVRPPNTAEAKRQPAPFGGRLNARASLRGSGNSLAAALAGLRGSVNATLEGGFFGTGAEKKPFTRFAFRADDLSGTPAPKLTVLPAALPYRGRWQVAYEATNQPLSVNIGGSGRVDFDTAVWLPIAIRDLAFRATGKVANLPFSLTGKGTGDSTNLRVESLSGRVNSADVTVDVTREVTKKSSLPHWQATGSFSASNLRAFLTAWDLNFTDYPEQALRRLNVTGKIDLHNNTLRLEELRGQLDNTTFTASVSRESAAIPKWTTTVHLDSMDLDLYRAVPPSSPAPAATPWDTAFMRELSLTGNITVNQLIFLDIILNNCRVPLTLTSGILQADPIVGQASGGSAFARVRAEHSPSGLMLRLQSELRAVNMLTLRRAPAIPPPDKSLLSGKGTFVTDLSGSIRSSADIPAALNGTWSAEIANGYFESGSSRRFFKALSASGSMRSGVLSSSDLFVNGSNFMVRGRGTVNLVLNVIDYHLNASLPGLPNVPITYSGPLNDPKRRINAASAFGGAISNLGKGVFSILDNVLSAPLKFIR